MRGRRTFLPKNETISKPLNPSDAVKNTGRVKKVYLLFYMNTLQTAVNSSFFILIAYLQRGLVQGVPIKTWTNYTDRILKNKHLIHFTKKRPKFENGCEKRL